MTKAACQGRLFISKKQPPRLAANHVDDQLHPVAVGQRSLASRLLVVDEDDDRLLLRAVEAFAVDDVERSKTCLEGELILLSTGDGAFGQQVSASR
jgi:hypothetical protein